MSARVSWGGIRSFRRQADDGRGYSGAVTVVSRAPRPLESTTQSAIVAALRRIGCDVMVHAAETRAGRRLGPAPGFPRGFCDLLILDAPPGAGVIFAEVKRAGENPRPEQLAMHTRLRRGGATVAVWHSAEQAVRDVMAMRAKR